MTSHVGPRPGDASLPGLCTNQSYVFGAHSLVTNKQTKKPFLFVHDYMVLPFSDYRLLEFIFVPLPLSSNTKHLTVHDTRDAP